MTPRKTLLRIETSGGSMDWHGVFRTAAVASGPASALYVFGKDLLSRPRISCDFGTAQFYRSGEDVLEFSVPLRIGNKGHRTTTLMQATLSIPDLLDTPANGSFSMSLFDRQDILMLEPGEGRSIKFAFRFDRPEILKLDYLAEIRFQFLRHPSIYKKMNVKGVGVVVENFCEQNSLNIAATT